MKVTSEKGRGEATVIGIDPASGMYRVTFDAVEASDGKGNNVSASGFANGEGYAAGKSMTKRRKA